MSELPPELRDLIAAERTSPLPASRIAVRSKLAASVGSAPLGHLASVSLAGPKVLAILAVVAGAGTIAAVTHSSAPATHRPAPVAVTPTVEQAPPLVPAHTEIALPAPPPQSRASIKKPSVTAPRPEAVAEVAPVVVDEPTPIAAVASEAELLHRAWDARAHDPAQALALVVEDERLYPDGVLAEERDALRISALAKLNRLGEARVAATHFFAVHPDSVHRVMIERSIDATTDTMREPR